MLRSRQTAGGRRSRDWVKPLGMQRLFIRGRADCGLCQVTSCLHALGYASYIIRRERQKGTFYGVFSFWCSFLNLLSASVAGSRETRLMCIHIHPKAFSNQCWFIYLSKQDATGPHAWSRSLEIGSIHMLRFPDVWPWYFWNDLLGSTSIWIHK